MEKIIMEDGREGPDARFPPGFHFTPNDSELILYYLRKKIENVPLLYDVFKDVNLYEYHPEKLVEKFRNWGENRWYFFTPRDRKYPNGTRPNRRTVDGYWKATGVEKKILYNGEQIGVRKALVFYTGKAGKGEKTDWIMYEYINQYPSELPRRPDGTMKLDDWVLCTIQKKRGADGDKSNAPEEPSRAQEEEEGQQQHANNGTIPSISSEFIMRSPPSYTIEPNYNKSIAIAPSFIDYTPSLMGSASSDFMCCSCRHLQNFPSMQSNDLSYQHQTLESANHLRYQHQTLEPANQQISGPLHWEPVDEPKDSLEAELKRFLEQVAKVYVPKVFPWPNG